MSTSKKRKSAPEAKVSSTVSTTGAAKPPAKRASISSGFGMPDPKIPTLEGEDTLTLDGVLACVRVIAESMACLPFVMFENSENEQDQKKAINHPTYDVFRWQANDEMTAYDCRIWIFVEALIRKFGVAQLIRNGRGQIIEMWPLCANQLTPKRAPDDNRLIYTYTYTGVNREKVERMFEKEEIFLIQLLPVGGLIGLALTELQKEMLGSAKATEDYATEFFSNGGVVSGTLEVAEELDEESYQRLKKDWAEAHSGKGNRHKVPILEGGAKFNPFSLDHEESQLLETQKFKRSKIASIFRVPAHLINDLEKATFSNIEHQDLGFVKHTLRPLMTNVEQKAQMALPPAERKRYYFKHNTRDLERGDFKTRCEGYASAVQTGWMSLDDCRRAEDLPVLGKARGGDTHFIQSSLIPVEAAMKAQPKSAEQPSTKPNNAP